MAALERFEHASQYLVLRQFVSWFVVATAEKVLAVLIDDFDAEAVKGVNGDFVGLFADDLAQAFAHIDRPALGKCQAEDVRWQHVRFA